MLWLGGVVVQLLWDDGLLMAVNIGFAALVVQQQIVCYYPVAFIGVVEVVGMLALTALLIVLSVIGVVGRACAVDSI